MNKNVPHLQACAHCKTLFKTDANAIIYCSLRCYLEARVEKGGWDKCWPWKRHQDRNGYGRGHFKGRDFGAHVATWEVTNGPVPKGFCVCHTCDNPPCCNPTHLWLGTTGDNTRDASVKGRLSTANRKPVICLTTGERFPSLTDAANAVRLNTSSICQCLRGRTKTSGGKTWAYDR
jgi:hypothetical protein